MASIQNLETLFNQKMNDLYSLQIHPYKPSADLDPIIVYAPNDPNRPQGSSNISREVPINAVLVDQARFAKFLLNTKGLKFFLKQELLQTGNAISETRVIDPLFITKNLAPFVHSKRQLFDQTDIVVDDPNRSPATMPDVGLAGRLQRQTGAEAISNLMGAKNARQSIIDVLSASQIGQTVSGILSITNGTYGVDQRPEFDVHGKWYSAVLYTGRTPLINRELDVVIDALGAVGIGSSIIGLPNIFAGLRGQAPSPATSNFSTQGSDPLGVMPYFNPDIPGVDSSAAGRYVVVKSLQPALPAVPAFLPSEVKNLIEIGISTAAQNLLGLTLGTVGKLVGGLTGAATRFASVLSFKPTVELSPEIAFIQNDNELENFTHPERSLRTRYENPTDASTVLSADARFGIQTTKDRFDAQVETFKAIYPNYATDFIKIGFVGGITPTNINQITDAKSSVQVQEVFNGIFRNPNSPHYSSYDALQATIAELPGTKMPTEVNGVPVPTDLIKVHFVDTVNSRVIPFRALLTGLTETVKTEYTDTRYIGRTERNILYLGALRNLSFGIYLHAWSALELQSIWKRINTLTGLAFPAKYSPDGFMVPPIIKLTIGDVYQDQPGYLTSVAHSIEDGTSWDIEEGRQVPQTVKVELDFAVIEKHSMHALAAFYGFGFPQTNPQTSPLPAAVTSVGPIASFTTKIPTP